ncbi:MAG: class I SAM-dependent methyltransferase [Oscillospiraceae bacterium]|jgi:SAM-dependent methyltransferase|nr:class I SAM-dependent methyltransferase [Oscillospiraceae bacterium]
MNAYTVLAPYYDALMAHADYGGWADFAERRFARLGRPVRLALDLGCGAGALSAVLAERGYEVIGVDASPDMLACAAARCAGLPLPPLFLCQPLQRLDLYGTVDAAVSSFDSFNYLTDPAALRRALARVFLFLEPGGLLLFDVRPPGYFEAANGTASVSQTDDLHCVWRTDWNARARLARHSVTLFVRAGGLWRRYDEEHCQRAYTEKEWLSLLGEAGFCDVRLYGDKALRRPRPEEERWFLSARKPAAGRGFPKA